MAGKFVAKLILAEENFGKSSHPQTKNLAAKLLRNFGASH